MKTIKTIIVAAIAAFFSVAAIAAVPSSITQYVPQTINYQGYLANPNTGAAYTDGIYNLDVRLYRAASGGEAVWAAGYSVYVKDGYFNIMLGDSSASKITTVPNGRNYPAYGVTELWKALWNDASVSQNYNLWLGVTPRQSATNATISSPTEISPRQQLLAAPYAFRAQAAQYAESSQGDFTVPGKLTVTGEVTFPESYSIAGLNYNATSSIMNIGGRTISSANPQLNIYGSRMYVNPYSFIRIAPQAGDINMLTGSSHSTVISGGAFDVAATRVGMSASGETAISSDTAISLSVPADKEIKGQGKFVWRASSGESYKAPIKLIAQTVTIPKGQTSTSLIFSLQGDVNYAYAWSVAGVNGNGRCDAFCARTTSNGTSGWGLFVTQAATSSTDVTCTVHLLGTHAAITNDAR